MSQATFDSDDLFGEAASEVRGDVEENLDAAREALPAPEAIWEVEAENTLGVLNTLNQALDVGDAEAHLRDAKKWYTMGERAEAFEDAEDLEVEIESIEEMIEDVQSAREKVGDLTSTVPGLRSALNEAQDAGGEDAEEADDGSEQDETDEDEDEADDE
ncbi:hypothetical protein BRC86_06095 [Halobacteriales archaeon QS_3_64_16]|nr:MAG: hypothetical protein BRC86_06095 [Halobacteriales archaeon QS_3_64_16]